MTKVLELLQSLLVCTYQNKSWIKRKVIFGSDPLDAIRLQIPSSVLLALNNSTTIESKSQKCNETYYDAAFKRLDLIKLGLVNIGLACELKKRMIYESLFI